jgi:hypothetical protein
MPAVLVLAGEPTEQSAVAAERPVAEALEVSGTVLFAASAAPKER